MAPVSSPEGTYARKQLFCADPVIAWSHRSRFRLARRLVEPFAGRRLLDFGCGDGTFLSMVSDLFPDASGTDSDRKQLTQCADRFAAEVSGLRFFHASELSGARYAGAFEIITCMEVLEHCLPEDRARVIAELARLGAPSARVVVSVPVEIGPSLLAKELLRTIAALRRLGDYEHKEKYTVKELATMVVAGPRSRIYRPVYRAVGEDGKPSPYHGHKGFNWKALKAELGTAFRIEETRFSPLGLGGGAIASQAWFVCSRR